jgi:16S rRNA (guanine966-N2)-methyltransferase
MPASNRPTISGGVFRGRRLEVPPGRGTRPTRSLVRQALFNMLTAEVPGARVLDLYSGSGALGLEALSRGADFVRFVENNRAALKALTTNIGACGLGSDRAEILAVDARHYVPTAPEGYSLVHADPPFVRDDPLPQGLEQPGMLTADAVLAWHAPAERPPVPHLAGWVLDRSRLHGRSAIHIYRRA